MFSRKFLRYFVVFSKFYKILKKNKVRAIKKNDLANALTASN